MTEIYGGIAMQLLQTALSDTARWLEDREGEPFDFRQAERVINLLKHCAKPGSVCPLWVSTSVRALCENPEQPLVDVRAILGSRYGTLKAVIYRSRKVEEEELEGLPAFLRALSTAVQSELDNRGPRRRRRVA